VFHNDAAQSQALSMNHVRDSAITRLRSREFVRGVDYPAQLIDDDRRSRRSARPANAHPPRGSINIAYNQFRTLGDDRVSILSGVDAVVRVHDLAPIPAMPEPTHACSADGRCDRANIRKCRGAARQLRSGVIAIGVVTA
jgi:hypothetical protein